MSGAVIFLNLAGAVALLLWATRMVRTGVERAFGAALNVRLRRTFSSAPRAIVAGGGLAIAFQSATAVALLVAAFAAGGFMPAARAIAAVAGADLGSALVTRILRLDLALLVPVLLVAGTVVFRSAESGRRKQIGRILLGVGLLLLSLRLIGEATEPLRDGEVLPILLGYLSRDWVSAFLLAALMTWLFHSSIAAVLLVATLADRGVIPPVLLVPLVLGINFGAALVAAYLGRGMAHLGRVVLHGNLALRGLGAAAMLGLHAVVALDGPLSQAFAPGDAVVAAHVAFNALIALSGGLLAGPLAALVQRLTPAPQSASGLEQARASALTEADLATPSRALANAGRELLTMCERVELMLQRVFELLDAPQSGDLEALQRLDDEVDETHTRIKLYLARIPDEALTREQRAELNDILTATIRLEQIADIISQNMGAKVRKKLKRQVTFSPEGWRELRAIHDEVQQNARTAFNLLMTRDLDSARELAESKETIRRMEAQSEESHLDRLRSGIEQSRDTSALHIDTIRDLKEVNSLLVSLTYPVLEREGMLRDSRLR